MTTHALTRFPIGDKAELRMLVETDATQEYANGLNDPEVYRFMTGTRQTRQTLESIRSYIRANLDDPRAILFGIFIDGDLRGTTRLHSIDEKDRSAHMGITIFDRSYWGRGWARRAIRAVADYGFSDRGLRSIYAGIYSKNLASQRSFAAAGFRCLRDNDHSDDLGQAQLWACLNEKS